MSNKENNKPTATEGKKVTVHYRGTNPDGTVFDSSYDRGSPIEFTIGNGQMIKGFESNVSGMALGQKKTFTIDPSEAYGERSEEQVMDVPREAFPPDFEFVTGESVQGSGPDGRPVIGSILEVGEEKVKLDFNHPMAGKTLTFEVELVEVD